jgi:hypothetical protein
MRLVIAQFFNEAYLLPWWLKHHREMFDHGVLIDDHSTDGSADICRELVPDWEVVQAEYTPFETILRDFEVMKHESRFPDAWKIALNITEFLVTPSLSALETLVLGKGQTAARLHAALMVDADPHLLPDPNRPLVEQKNCGLWEDRLDIRLPLPEERRISFGSRRRIYHSYLVGAYEPGRHISNLPGQYWTTAEQGAIWWYAFSPWCEEFKARKLQIGATIADHDRKVGWGAHHHFTQEQMEEQWGAMRPHSRPLFPRTLHPKRRLRRLGEIALRTKRDPAAPVVGANPGGPLLDAIRQRARMITGRLRPSA